jgi:hypothetical protein
MTTVRVKVLKSEDSNYHVNLIKFSRGSSGSSARALANNIQFHVGQADSTLNLPQGFTIVRGEKFRNQQVRVEVAVPVGKRILVNSSVDDYHWFNIHPGRRHIRWDNGKDWNVDWDEDIDDNDTYSYSTNVEYMMTANGLVRTDRRDSDVEDRNSRKHRKDQKDSDDDDDQPEYKSEKTQPKTEKGGGGYRYKSPEAPAKKTDSVEIKKTAMVVRSEEGRLLSALSRV